MSLPVTYTMWQERQVLCKDWADAPAGFCYSKKEALGWSANWLIERLYDPCTLERHPWGTITAKNLKTRTEPFDCTKELINWGDLSAHVEELGDAYIVVLEEASDGQCPELCAYVTHWLTAWGWTDFKVETEW